MPWEIDHLKQVLPNLPTGAAQAWPILQNLLNQLPDSPEKRAGLQLVADLQAGRPVPGLADWLACCPPLPPPTSYNLPGAPPPPR